MTVFEIYQKYQIPPNLIRHQLEVTAVGRYICDHWLGEPVNKKLVTEVLLLHDMGNIIKFKRPFLGELEQDAKHWEEVQQQFIRTYGTDVHIATLAIARELRVPTRIEELLIEMHDVWTKPEKRLSSVARICEHADCCVTPDGVRGFVKRIQDLQSRYHMSYDRSHVQLATKNARFVEKSVSVDLSKVAEVDFSEEIEKLRRYSFEL